MSANKVGEIFTVAGTAFSQLGELTMQLHPSLEPPPGGSTKWTNVEIDMLHAAVKRFGEDLNKVSGIIKSRCISQMKTQAKKKTFEEAGLSPPSTAPAKKVAQSPSRAAPHAKKQKTSEMTLSALNAPEGDIDIEGLGHHNSDSDEDDDDDDEEEDII